jgi:hypothetical protein
LFDLRHGETSRTLGKGPQWERPRGKTLAPIFGEAEIHEHPLDTGVQRGGCERCNVVSPEYRRILSSKFIA